MNHMGLSAIHPSVVVVVIVDHGITVHHTRLSDTPRTSLCRGEACLHPGGRLSSNHCFHRSPTSSTGVAPRRNPGNLGYNRDKHGQTPSADCSRHNETGRNFFSPRTHLLVPTHQRCRGSGATAANLCGSKSGSQAIRSLERGAIRNYEWNAPCLERRAVTLFATLARSEAEKVGGQRSSETQAHAAEERLDVSCMALIRSRQYFHVHANPQISTS